MNDKRNSDLFINESLDGMSSINNLNTLRGLGLKSPFYQSNHSLNSINSSASANTQAQLFGQANQCKSYVIICHFDFFNYEFNHDASSLAAGLSKKEKTPSLPETTNNVRQGTPFSTSVYYGHYENSKSCFFLSCKHFIEFVIEK